MGSCCSQLNQPSIPDNLDPKSLPAFIPHIIKGRVIKCYDGDTITIAAYLPYKNSHLYKFSVRLAGIDCPELRTDNKNEKAIAIKARDILSSRILGKIVYLKNHSTEKYGRILADVIYKNESCGDWLIKQRLAVPYAGKTKICPTNWVKYHNNSI
jgi:micrococcal nuclease